MVRRLLALTSCALALMGAGKPRTSEQVLKGARAAIEAYDGRTEGIAAAFLELERVVASDPANALAHALMGTILIKRACGGGGGCDDRLLGAAMDKFEASLKVDPKLPEGVVGRGWIFKLRRDDWGAENLANEALELRPGFASAIFLKGDIAKGQRRWDAAIEAGTELVSATRAPYDQILGHTLLASGCAGAGRDDCADKSHRALIALEPKSAWNKGNYAAFLARTKRFDDAITWAKAALAVMDYGAARQVLKTAYRGKAKELRDKDDEKGAQKYEALADAVNAR